MVPSEFKIGSTLVGMAYLGSLTTPVPAPLVEQSNWDESIELESGGVRAGGSTPLNWRFGVLTQAQRDQLKSFCPGASATVYIRTKRNDGTYASYQTTMYWPRDEKRDSGHYLDMVIKFDFLVAV